MIPWARWQHGTEATSWDPEEVGLDHVDTHVDDGGGADYVDTHDDGGWVDLAEASLSLRRAAIRAGGARPRSLGRVGVGCHLGKYRLDWTEPTSVLSSILSPKSSYVCSPRAFIRHHGNSADSVPPPGRHGQLFRSISAAGKGGFGKERGLEGEGG